MAMFVCLRKDKWVMARCDSCDANCGLSHPMTQEIGAHLFGEGFDSRKPAGPEPVKLPSEDQQ